MSPRALYVVEHGATLCKRGEQLLVEKDDAVLLEVELANLASIVLLDSVQVTSQALSAALRAGVSFAFVSSTGELLGQLVPPISRNAVLRLAQFNKDSDPEFCFLQGKTILAAKIENQRQVLLRHTLDYPGPQDQVEPAVATLQSCCRRIHAAADLHQLLGIEGEAAAAYWQAFPHLLTAEGITFPGRRKRPPPDPVNAVLSFGYTLLTTRLVSALQARGFDPWVGFLHMETYGHPSLALDLLELFRAPVVDRLAIRLFNLGILKPSHFHPAEEGGVRMTEEGLRNFFRHWEQALTKLDLQRVLQSQVDQLARVYLGQEEQIKPWLWSAR